MEKPYLILLVRLEDLTIKDNKYFGFYLWKNLFLQTSLVTILVKKISNLLIKVFW